MTSAEGRKPLSRTTTIIVWMIGAALVAWFFFAWLVMEQDIVDAAGESVGSALVILLLVSIGGMVVKRK